MPTTKLIYGVGRVPKASEFALGEIIVNVDDSKVYSKNKQNTVFEIGGGTTTTINNTTTTAGFATASISASGFFTSRDTSNLIISGGTGISVTTGSNNQITITATGDSRVTDADNALTASYVEVAQTASYVNVSSIDGDLFQFLSDGDQGGIIFSENDINIYDTVEAYAAGLSETSNVTFAQVSSSGLLFASASEEITGGDNIRTVVYDTGSGRFYFTGSYGSGGSTLTGTDTQVLFFDGDNNPVGDPNLTFNNSTAGFQAAGSITSSEALIGDLRIVGDKIQPRDTDLTFLEIDPNDARIQFNIGGAQFFKIDKEPDTSEFVLGNPVVSSSFAFYTKGFNANTPALFVSNSGEVGIGTDTPGEKLEVIGNISASSGNVYANFFGRNDSNNIEFTTTNGGAVPVTTFEVNGFKALELKSGETRINPNGANYDFIVEGADDSNLFKVDGVENTVNIGLDEVDGDEYILGVNGNIKTFGYVAIGQTDNINGGIDSPTAVAGGLLYSSSHEFYLGFPS